MRFQICSSVFAAVAGLAVVLGSPASADVLSKAQELGVSSIGLQEIVPVASRDGRMTMLSVNLDGRHVFVEVAPHSVRSDSFRVVLDRGNGVMEEITPPPSNAVRGVIVDEPGSLVAGTIVDGAVNLLLFTGERVWTVQPAPEEGPGVHAVFDDASILDHQGSCEVPDGGGAFAAEEEPQVHHLAQAAMNRGTGDFRVAEIAIEADWRLYNNGFNRNETALLNDIDSVLAGVSAVYERDVALTYELTHVLVRTTSASDPYDTNAPGTLLNQFRNEWNTNQTDVPRDVAHLWSGRNFDGSTIGIAYLSVICSASSYGANQILFSGNFNSRVGLFAHELGHNWAAEHCNDDPECRIMCSGINGCNGLGNPARFAAGPIAQINSHISTRSCVDNVGIDLPVLEDFNGSVLRGDVWSGFAGFSFVTDGSAPSGNRAGRLTQPFTVLSSLPIDMAVAPQNGVVARLWVRPEAETAEPFEVYVNEADEPWKIAGRIFVDGTSGYQKSEIYLPASVKGREVRLILTPPPTGASWRLDDFAVFESALSPEVASVPFAEDFERAALFRDSWQPSDVDVVQDGANAPQGSFIATMPAGGRMETADLNASGAGEIPFGVLVSAPAGSGAGDELVMQYRNPAGAWIEASRISAASLASESFTLAEVVLPADAAHASLRVALEVSGGAPGSWRFDDLRVGGDSRASDCVADLAPPAGVLDLSDIGAFIDGFTTNGAIADLAAPFGVFDLSDVNTFIQSFTAGCP